MAIVIFGTYSRAIEPLVDMTAICGGLQRMFDMGISHRGHWGGGLTSVG